MWMMLKPLSGHLKSLIFSTFYFTYISRSNSLRLPTQTSLLHWSDSPHNFLFLFVAQYSSSPLAGYHSPQWTPVCSLSQIAPSVLFSVPTAISFRFILPSSLACSVVVSHWVAHFFSLFHLSRHAHCSLLFPKHIPPHCSFAQMPSLILLCLQINPKLSNICFLAVTSSLCP